MNDGEGIEIKTCPQCLEDINAEASRCKHCGSWQEERVTERQAAWIALLLVLIIILVALEVEGTMLESFINWFGSIR